MTPVTISPQKVLSPFDPKNIVLDKLNSSSESTVPFQEFLDKAVDSLQEVSNVEFKNNDLIQQYAQGKASIDDVMISTSQLTLAMSLATTMVQTAVTTFKEIQQMPV